MLHRQSIGQGLDQPVVVYFLQYQDIGVGSLHHLGDQMLPAGAAIQDVVGHHADESIVFVRE